MEELLEKIKKVADLIEKSSHVVVLTGAGVSTESGVPDFRTPGSGFWTMVDPDSFTIGSFKNNPAAFYETGAPFFTMMQDAQPNESHTVLAELEKRGLIKALITQNVDGLHQEAGSKRVLEMHGTLKTASCVHCKKEVSMEEVAADVEEGVLPPRCSECGEPLKPNVVLFGEPLPPDYHEALEEAGKADLMLVIGSSLHVSPVNELPSYSKKVVVINRTPTHYDEKAEVVINDESAGRVLKLLLEELDKRK
jgi:NAD-dependent deacetylase